MTEPAGSVPARWLDRSLRTAGFVVALAMAFLVALYGAFLTPFRIGTTLVPIALLIAAGGIVGVVWFTYQVTNHRVLAMLPCVVWVAASFPAAIRTHDGDLILTSDNWVASSYLLVGPAAIAVCAYRLFRPGR